jgi:hypothetical protein
LIIIQVNLLEDKNIIIYREFHLAVPQEPPVDKPIVPPRESQKKTVQA